jgi:hypothetical protein
MAAVAMAANIFNIALTSFRSGVRRNVYYRGLLGRIAKSGRYETGLNSYKFFQTNYKIPSYRPARLLPAHVVNRYP